ncbi:MAG: prolyl oligopeptidase family serine peptidase, partial [Flavobacteriaceae bacterium]|nr:prolyl oligopeptidase family serine peptidase [Flavobacteriaceae bacterium]
MKNLFYGLLFLTSATIVAQEVLKPEVLPQKKVTNTYHGITLEDPYQYLENLDDPTVITWMKDNANYATSILNNISGKKELFDNMKELVERRSASISSVNITDDDTYYYLKRVPGEEISKMYKRNGYDGDEELFFDPTKYKTEDDKIFTISSITPNIKGDKIAVGVSPNGSENPELLIFKSNGEQYEEILHLAKGISWHLSGDSFFYFKMNSADLKDVNRQIYTSNYVHKVGTDQSLDEKSFSKENYAALDLQDSELPYIMYSKEANKNILYAGSVDKNAKVYINDTSGNNNSWKSILKRDNKVTDIGLNSYGVYYLTYDDAPNYKIVKTSIDKPEFSNSSTVIEESETEIITGFSLTKDGLFYATVKNGVEAKVYFLANGKSNVEELQLPFTAGSAYISTKGSEFSDVWISISGWTSPNKRFLYDPMTKMFTFKPLSTPVEYPELNNLIAEEITVESHDGVMVPVSIIHKKGLEMNGNNPAVLYSYGAYGISTSPFFSPIVLAYTMYNGILVVPHIRGGGELGDAWHKAGQKLNKPNTWKDAIATAEYLIKNEYSNSDKISIFGGSAGGILVGRSITERPDLFVAAAPMVGCMNTVRAEETPNGPINTPEFGTIEDPDEFKGLLAMDSYHSLKPGTDYPATLVTAGMNDPRVIAWQPSKFAAKMQHDNKGDSPILFYTNFAGKNLTVTKCEVITEDTSDFSIQVIDDIIIESSGTSEIY